MFRDIINSVFKKPATELYPFEKTPAPERLRGKLHWTPEGCTGCAICVKDCPARAIELITIDKAAKRFAMKYHTDRCTFCGQCVYSCRFDCLSLVDEEWELAAGDKSGFTLTYGNPEDVEAAVAMQAPRPAPAAANAK
jgi:NAD(P)H-quinone oxidoreductase subunit I/formate hydrogenlyase subunit 6